MEPNAKRLGECHAHYSRSTRCQSRATSRRAGSRRRWSRSARLRLFRSLRPRLAATAARGASAMWEPRKCRQAAPPPHQPLRAALIRSRTSGLRKFVYRWSSGLCSRRIRSRCPNVIEAGRDGGKGDETRGCRRAACPLKRVVRVRGERHEPLVRRLGFSERDCCRRAGTERMQIAGARDTVDDQTEHSKLASLPSAQKPIGEGVETEQLRLSARLQGGWSVPGHRHSACHQAAGGARPEQHRRVPRATESE